MAHPAPGAPQPGTKIFQYRPASRTYAGTRPEHQRPGTRRAVGAREPQITAGRRVRIDRQRARPYDGHGRHRLGSLLAVGATRAFPTPRMCRQRLRRPAPRRPAAPGRRHVAFVAEQPEKRRSETTGDQQMPATLKVTHKAIGAEVRRGTYDVVVDGERAGSVEMNHTIEIPVEPGRHTLQVRNGRNSSSTQNLRRRPGRDRRLPMHRKEVLADLSRILCRAQAGAETRSRLSRRRRRGAHQHVVIAAGGVAPGPGQNASRKGSGPLPASPGATGSTA